MSLRDQLLKAGLVNKKQVSQTQAAQKKLEHDSKKNKELADALNEKKSKEEREIQAEFEQRRLADLELNKQRDLMIAQREQLFRAKQIIKSNALNERNANEIYFFAEGNFVRKVYVTAYQRELLSRGRIAITRLDDDVDEFILVPANSAQLLKEICAPKILTHHSPVDDELLKADESNQ